MKDNRKIILAMIITFLMSSLVSVAASGHLFDSNEVVYDNTNSGMSSTNVKGAVDELYAAATDYSNINSRVTTLEQTTNTLNSSVSSLNTSVGSLNTSVGTLQSDVHNLKIPGFIEFSGIPSTAGHGGYIDFHYNGSTVDYTSRIIGGNGTIDLKGTNGIYINGTKVGDLIKVKKAVLYGDTIAKGQNIGSLASIDSGYKFLAWQPFAVSSGWTMSKPIYIADTTVQSTNIWWDEQLGISNHSQQVFVFYYEIKNS